MDTTELPERRVSSSRQIAAAIAGRRVRYLMSTAKHRFYPCLWTVLCILRGAARSFRTFPPLFFNLNIGLGLFSLFSSSLIHQSLSPLTPLALAILQSPVVARSVAARPAAAVCPSCTLFVLYSSIFLGWVPLFLLFYLLLPSFFFPLLFTVFTPSLSSFFVLLFCFSNGIFCFVVLF